MIVIERQANLQKLTGATVANFPTPVIQIIKQSKDNGSKKLRRKLTYTRFVQDVLVKTQCPLHNVLFLRATTTILGGLGLLLLF